MNHSRIINISIALILIISSAGCAQINVPANSKEPAKVTPTLIDSNLNNF